MSNKRQERVYNKDRIQRIKEASEKAKQNDPNWKDDAPASILPDEEDDMPITQMRTPPFLKEIEHNTLDLDVGLSKKLTLNELTQCNKDSSQLQDIMNSSNFSRNQHKNESRSVNYLEKSRLKKVKERDDLNRQTAESLDKASERWHYQLKEYNKNKNTQDSAGVKYSLFNDEADGHDKSEKERNEKRLGSRRVSGDFVDRLDLLLQRGTRHSKMFSNMSNLRRINERSFNRWSGKFDKSSSMWDLRYSLLCNNREGGIRSNHFTPGLSPLKSELNLVSNRNSISDLTGMHNARFQYPPPLINNNANINPNLNINPNFQYHPNMGFPLNYNTQNFNQFSPNLNQLQTPITNSVNLPLQNPNLQPLINTNQFGNPFEVQIQPNQPTFPQNATWSLNFPQQSFQQTFPNIPNNYSQNLLPSTPAEICLKPNDLITTNTNSSSTEATKTFESVTRKIDILVEKLEVLNFTVDQLKSAQTRQTENSAIKPQRYVSVSSEVERIPETKVKGIYRPTNNPCNCPDCKRPPDNQQTWVDRKVKFDLISEKDKEKRIESKEIVEVDTAANLTTTTNNQIEAEQSFTYPKNCHPRAVQKQFYQNLRISDQFQSFHLPPELSKMLDPNTRRSS